MNGKIDKVIGVEPKNSGVKGVELEKMALKVLNRKNSVVNCV